MVFVSGFFGSSLRLPFNPPPPSGRLSGPSNMLERREVLESIIKVISLKMLIGLYGVKRKGESLELSHSPRLKLKEH